MVKDQKAAAKRGEVGFARLRNIHRRSGLGAFRFRYRTGGRRAGQSPPPSHSRISTSLRRCGSTSSSSRMTAGSATSPGCATARSTPCEKLMATEAGCPGAILRLRRFCRTQTNRFPISRSCPSLRRMPFGIRYRQVRKRMPFAVDGPAIW